ncbi:fatty-acyl-CoA synthase [Caulobacter ginsengisoli]|uniref:Fatty-acyl-CoA synthase n=1 Tax=Caulobacter ginsengisoli TaxID=400775 RepID=A0ABU0IQL9_9CAUL|nr:DUF1499 domain-containing protein [Caulobacter ginsengisoli]MDQ0464306.1 fatty-acyl-CoA synthase [Caulobacter ginsengisoli]
MTKFRDGWVRLALILSLLLPVYFIVAALGTKFGLFNWRIGFGLLVYVLGKFVLFGVLGFALIALVLALVVSPRRGWGRALVALLIPVLMVGFVVVAVGKAKEAPPIHDIATNIQDPPSYSPAVSAARAAIPGASPIESMTAPMSTLAAYKGKADFADKTVGALGQKANPDLVPLTLPLTVANATTLAASVARDQGLKVSKSDPAAGRVEATAESFWFGFKDDFVVRVRPGPDGKGSVVDVRSTSRVGVGDMGANAKRIRAFLATVKAKGLG